MKIINESIINEEKLDVKTLEKELSEKWDNIYSDYNNFLASISSMISLFEKYGISTTYIKELYELIKDIDSDSLYSFNDIKEDIEDFFYKFKKFLVKKEDEEEILGEFDSYEDALKYSKELEEKDKKEGKDTFYSYEVIEKDIRKD